MTQRIRDLGWVAAPAALSAALVLSLSFIAPATAAPGNGNGQGQERAQAHFAKAKRHDTSKPQEPRRVRQVATSDDTAERSPRSNGGSAVRLDKPNDFQAQADPDGKIRIVVSDANPGVTNWCETLGHGKGYLQFRWQRVSRELTDADGPTMQVVDLDEVPGLLPYHESNKISDEDWRQRIALRQKLIGERMVG